MNSSRTLTSLLLLALVLGTSGCKFIGKKKPNLPPQATAPTITTTQTATQNPGPPPPATAEPSRPMPTPGEVVEANNIQPKNLPKPPRVIARKPPKKTIVENEPPAPQVPQQQPPDQLSASIAQDDALNRKVETAQLIEATETNLRSIKRNLSNSEQTMVQHIRSFVKDSQNATANRDYEMAYKLAVKAHLLSDELTKPR